MIPNFRKFSSRRGSSSLRKPRPTMRFVVWAALAVLLYVAYSYFGGSYGLIKLWRLKQRQVVLNREVMQLQVQQDSLRREIQLLQNDSTYIEKVARERYKMGKPGEKIYTIVKQNKP
ncbi:MAG: septum formation initiator family protein [candidate division KSB1 bacterium]|nr:septum formation initiator family protein [candidate division KSB1 bacterium]MDZ7304753.1 septum formation initiator family protein [candidate division KSB1 bacterium]MDZ7314213.1 septum formation initiator family protein [candidate division KSB1 bacterium]